MIEEMAGHLENFPGPANQTRCFLHILNLTAKSILHQFEVPKKKAGEDRNDDNEIVTRATSELLALSSEIEDDSADGVDDQGEDGEDGEGEDNEEGYEDERQKLTAEQLAELNVDLIPVRLMLTKVCLGASMSLSKIKTPIY